jgi:hypothetical protein
MTNYLGIDYSLGTANFDPKTGIRYGLIHHGTVGSAWYDESDCYTNAPNEKEIAEAIINDDKETLQALYADFGIEEIFEPDTDIEEMNDILSEKFWDIAECSEFYIDRNGLKATQSAESPDIWVIKSPFYTYGQFCSPCAPGAINLDNPLSDLPDSELPKNNRAYCLDFSWFEDGKAPYRVFRVSDNTEVFPIGE